jgi:mannose-6-phosphate isomerase
MRISLATPAELSAVFALYQAVIGDMQARGLTQWRWGFYPTEAILTEDVALRRLYKLEESETLIGVFALCVGQGEEYDGIPWQFGVRPACLHRVAIDQTASGRGYGHAVMEFVKSEAVMLGCDCLRVDTYSRNERALKLFAANTVREAGIFRFPSLPEDFRCFEAPLTEDCPLLPVRMHPAYRYGEETPWGGDSLAQLFGKPIPDARTGEALEVSCIPGLESTDDRGEPLSKLIARSGAGLTGEEYTAAFPLLLKLLCAKSDLSVQVHPDDAYALAHEGKLGKTEAWVILAAEEGSLLRYGLKDGVTRDTLAQVLLSGGDIEPLLNTVTVAAGDVFYMPSGMVHAIGGGITLYEIQQSSDVTYRLWDYNRVNEKGEKRSLQLRQSLDVALPELRGLRTRLPNAADVGIHTLLTVRAFTLACMCVAGEQPLAATPESFRIFFALESVTLCWEGGRLVLAAGESALLPALCPPLTVQGEGRVLIAAPGH